MSTRDKYAKQTRDRSVRIELQKRAERWKLNNAIVDPDGETEPRPFCKPCGKYKVFVESDSTFMCLICGQKEPAVKSDGGLVNDYATGSPIFVSRDMRKKTPSADFPEHAEIIKDTEYLGDGSSRELV